MRRIGKGNLPWEGDNGKGQIDSVTWREEPPSNPSPSVF